MYFVRLAAQLLHNIIIDQGAKEMVKVYDGIPLLLRYWQQIEFLCYFINYYNITINFNDTLKCFAINNYNNNNNNYNNNTNNSNNNYNNAWEIY